MQAILRRILKKASGYLLAFEGYESANPQKR